MATTPLKDYTFKIITLVIDKGCIVYRTCLERRAGNLQQHLLNNKQIIKDFVKGSYSKNPKLITLEQYNKIFPGGQAVTSAKDFDITLLAFLIRNTCPCVQLNNSNETALWDKNDIKDLQAVDTSETADLVRIRIFRNQILHIEKTELFDHNSFETKWKEISEVLIRCCPELKDEIEKLKKEPIDLDKVKWEQIQEIMNGWRNMDETLKEVKLQLDDHSNQLHDHASQLDDNHTKIEGHENQLHDHATKLNDQDNKLEHIQGNIDDHQKQLDRLNQTPEKSLCGTEDKIVMMLQHDLLVYYRKLFSRLAISPLIDEDEYALHFLEIFVKPILTIPSYLKLSKIQSESIPVKSCHDIFVNNSKQLQSIYISSPAGCGKTSLAKWLALTWCQAHQPIVSDNKWFVAEDLDEMRTFFFLFIIFLRDEHEQECDVDIIIQNQLLLNLANSTTYAELGSKFLQNLFNSVKCIVILDGLDEWSHPPGNMCKLKNKHIPHSRVRPLCTTLTTSRPWKLDVVGLKPGEIDLKLELNGLEDDSLKQLIGNVVTKMNALHGKEMKADSFIRELKVKKLMTLSKIPVVVMQLLTVWFDNEPLGESQCEIYSNMIEFLLKHYCRKREISVMEDIKLEDCNRDRQISMCLQNKMYCKAHMDLLSKLAILAYNTLFSNNEESSLVFDRRIATKYLSDKEIDMSLVVGILTQEKVLGKMSIRLSHSSFIHKTFQEFFAALYVCMNPGMVTNVEEKIKHVCCSIEKVLEMSQIFMFLSGLCPEVMVKLHEHLRQTESEYSGIQRYRASCELDRWSSEGRTLVGAQETMRECLVECWLNGHKHVTHLPVRDFFIWSPSQWSAEFKSLTFLNPVCSLYVVGIDSSETLEDILNSVTVFNSIEKLWLWQVSETFVVQLVSQHKHSLSVRPEIWRKLKYVTLERVRMSGDILCSLVDSILQLPTSVNMRLWWCMISQQTRDWRSYIRSRPELTVDDDDDADLLNDDAGRRWNVNLVQFHTNKV